MNDEPFYNTRFEEERAEDKRKVYTVSLNLEEQALLVEDMRVLRQAKDSTALKQLWKVGRAVLHDQKTGQILRAILDNTKKNKRVGIESVEPLLPTSNANVTQKREDL